MAPIRLTRARLAALPLALRLALVAAGLALVIVLAAVVPRLVSAPSGPPASGSAATSPSGRGTTAPSGTASTSPSSAPGSFSATARTSSPPRSAPPPTRAQSALARLSLEQRAAQAMMVGAPVAGADVATLEALRASRAANVFLRGRTTAGSAAVAETVATLRAAVRSTSPQSPFVATDQEGGAVQVLRGPGFTDMPAAVEQGRMAPAALRRAAAGWGRELAAVGITVNLAPVLDTVPSAGFAPRNAPIGQWGREYGYTPEAVAAHGIAFAQGMADGGVAAVPKHFPGLGRVTANTDTASGVSDPATTRKDPYIAPFAGAVAAGAEWLMVSNARYPAIDPGRDAVFSPTVMRGMLRGDLGFRGIIISDDICDAAQLAPVPPERRGADFLAAGGTMALCTNSVLAPRVWQGIVDRARADRAFARTVDDAALRVLEAKERAGLLREAPE
ncbi:glycoside hydrolase family 3 N-terminal domain-containing protein [Sinomonas halotolerans]|uniref:beta-N-acetylhexosaminidase n=1 Tax=Sinomonas halotolerans TaxID=1644133 RepID=A0ABU9WWJ5_9MICC